jgi:hypothetical protein
MLSPDEMTDAIGSARDQVLKVVLDHEQDTHQGRPCWGNRFSAIAHLAHSLGVTSADLAEVGKLVDVYDANCKDESCPHQETKE